MKKRSFHNPVGVGKFTGLWLISPFILGFAVFTLYPFISSFILGMTDIRGNFTGPQNYIDVLTSRDFRNSAIVTLRYTLILVPLKLIVSLLTAVLLNQQAKAIGFFRTAFYIPSILGSNMAIVIMWQFLFTADGLVNQLLRMVGLSPVSWYGDSQNALFIIILLRLWEFGSAMVIFLNALRDIPQEYYEAAKVDGCGNVRAFFTITLPLLRDVIFLNLVLQTISAMQEFSAPYMITGGGPMNSTKTIGILIYDEMYRFGDIGYANAVSWSLFVLVTAVVLVLFKLTGRLREADR